MTVGAIITFDVAAFRVAFPAFADESKYPDPMLQGYWDASTCIISDVNYGYLFGESRDRALNLLTAHMTQLGVMVANGQSVGVVTSATVGSVTVAVMPPPAKTQFQYWLYMTPYGAQLAALLSVKGVGGLTIGGLPERLGFRKIGGVFY